MYTFFQHRQKLLIDPNLYLHTKIPFGIFGAFDGLRTLGQFKDSTKVFQYIVCYVCINMCYFALVAASKIRQCVVLTYIYVHVLCSKKG